MLKFHIFWLSLLGFLLAFKVLHVAPEDKGIIHTLEQNNGLIADIILQHRFCIKENIRYNPKYGCYGAEFEEYMDLFDSTVEEIDSAEAIENVQKACYGLKENIGKLQSARAARVAQYYWHTEYLDDFLEEYVERKKDEPSQCTLNQYKNLMKNQILVDKLRLANFYEDKTGYRYYGTVPSIFSPRLTEVENPPPPLEIDIACSTRWSRKYGN